MGNLALVVGEAVEEHVAAFVKESHDALAEVAAGKPARVVPLEPMLQRVVLVLVGLIVSQLADQLRGGKVQNKHACQCGGGLLYKVTRPRTWGSTVGELVFNRAYYWCAKCKATQYPLEVIWGLRSVEAPAKGREYLTPAAGLRLAVLNAVLSYGQGCKQLKQLTGVRVSAMLAWRNVQRVGKRLRAGDAAARVKIAKGAAAGKGRQKLRWLVSADGIFVGFWMDARRRRRKEGAPAIKRRKGIRWTEVKVGVVALLDPQGKVVRGSQWYVASLEGAKSFRQTLWQVAQARGVWETDVVAVVTDGAKWLRALATRYFTWGVAIRDFYHASEHLRAMAEALYGEGALRARLWHRRMARRMKRGEIDLMLAGWERSKAKPKDAKTWARECAYFSTQREAMAYKQFLEQYLPIGSGCMEAGCKTQVAERHKVSGARWTKEGFRNLNAVRVCYQNGEPLPLSS